MTTELSVPLQPRTATIGEIHQQPAAWHDLVGVLAEHRAALDAFLADALAAPGVRIVCTGAGTSAFAGQIASETLRRRLGRRVDAVPTTGLVSDPATLLAEDVPVLLVSFARSGNSPESVAATTIVDELAPSAHHLVITCDADGLLARTHRDRANSFVLDMPAQTNDRGFAMTSSFTTMLLAALLAFLPEHTAAVDALGATATSIIDRADRIGDLLDVETRRIVYLGSGALEGVARESALKTLELTAGAIAAFHDTALGFRHGPKAVIDDGTLVVVYRSADPYTRQYDEDIVRELRAGRPDRVVEVGADTAGPVDVPLAGLDDLDDGFRGVAAVVVAQLLAHTASERLGCTPDNPFPDGSVNRVVQGVSIHPLPSGPAR